MAEKYGILKIIDDAFDEYNGSNKTTSKEYYSTIYSYLADVYDFITLWMENNRDNSPDYIDHTIYCTFNTMYKDQVYYSNDIDVLIENLENGKILIKNTHSIGSLNDRYDGKIFRKLFLKLLRSLKSKGTTTFKSKDDCYKKLIEEVENLKNVYYNTTKEIINKLEEIEYLKVQKISIPYGLLKNSNEFAYEVKKAFADMVIKLKNKYVDRDFFNGLQEENQKSGYNEEHPYEEVIYIGRNLNPIINNGKAEINYYRSYENETVITEEKTFKIITEGDNYSEQTIVDPDYFINNKNILANSLKEYEYRPIIDVYISLENSEGLKINSYNGELELYKDETKNSFYSKSKGVFDGDTVIHILPKSTNGVFKNTDNEKNENACLINTEKKEVVCQYGYSDETENGINSTGIVLKLKTGTYKVSVKYRYLVDHNVCYLRIGNKENNHFEHTYTLFENGSPYPIYSSTEYIFSADSDEAFRSKIINNDTTIINGDEGVSRDKFYIGWLFNQYMMSDSINKESKNDLFTTVVFSDGFLVDYLNNYENNISIFLDIFNSIEKTLNSENSDKKSSSRINYFKNYLKKYFYDGILERYRTNKIEDKNTDVKIADYNIEGKKFPVNNVYEKLNGKARNLNGLGTLDFGYYRKNGQNKFVNYKIDYIYISNSSSEFYTGSTYKLELYISTKNLDSAMRTIAKYGSYADSSGSSYLDHMASRYKKFQNTAFQDAVSYITGTGNYEGIGGYEKLKEIILKNYFFAVRINFQELDSNTFEFKKKENEVSSATKELREQFIEIRNDLENEFFYNDDGVCTIDFSFSEDGKYLILNVDTGVQGNNFQDKTSLGNGILYTKRLIQKLKDNIVSKSRSDFNIIRDILFEPQDFYSVLDDRDTSVVITSGMITDSDGSNLEKNDGKLTEINFPEYKYSDLYKDKKTGDYWLDVTNFSTYNDIEALQQIRIVDFYDNSEKYLFNVKGTKSIYITDTKFNIDLNFNTIGKVAKEKGVSYYDGSTIYLDANLIASAEEPIQLVSDDNETINIENENITISSNVDLGDNILYSNGTLVSSNVANNVKLLSNPYYYLDGNNYNIDSTTYYEVKKYLILEPNINSPDIALSEMTALSDNNVSIIIYPTKVKIVDYIISNGNSKFLELPKVFYDKDNNTKEFSYYEAKTKRISLSASNWKATPNLQYNVIFKGRNIYTVDLKFIYLTAEYNKRLLPEIKVSNRKRISSSILKYKAYVRNEIKLITIRANYYAPDIYEISYGIKLSPIIVLSKTYPSSFIYYKNATDVLIRNGLIQHNVGNYSSENTNFNSVKFYANYYITNINGIEFKLWLKDLTIGLTGKSNLFTYLYGEDKVASYDKIKISTGIDEATKMFNVTNPEEGNTTFDLEFDWDALNLYKKSDDYINNIVYNYINTSTELDKHATKEKNDTITDNSVNMKISEPTINLLKKQS